MCPSHVSTGSRWANVRLVAGLEHCLDDPSVTDFSGLKGNMKEDRVLIFTERKMA